MRSRLALLALLACLALPASALAGKLETLVMPGKLIAGHAKYEADCEQCHAPFSNTQQRSLCLNCHKTVAADLRTRTGLHGRSSEIQRADCQQCHTDHKGRNADIVQFNAALFNHANTDYPLKGAHARAACASCHKPGTAWRKTASTCHDCHQRDDSHQGKMGKDCSKCHNTQNWRNNDFNHDKTRYPLTGKHSEVACALCHVNNQYKNLPQQCVSCHRLNDVHNNRYGANCKQCHSTRNWKSSSFNHDKDTRFALAGKHKSAACVSCHKVDFKAKLARDCYSCHKHDDEHLGRYGKLCQDCHNAEKWSNKRFDHDKDTKFALRGKHRDIDCQRCHQGPAEKERGKTACHQCHGLDDSHRGRFGNKCQDCHSEKKWQDTRFNHDKDTKYPLRDKHREVKCHVCHPGPAEKERGKTACLDCHERQDIHRGQQGKQCQRCHSEAGWRGKVVFDHDTTRFPLLGLHSAAACEDCHVSAAYKGTKTECKACHSQRDVHKGRLGSPCQQCHNPNSWKFWQFRHDPGRYKLKDAHDKLNCLSCHKQVTDKLELRQECDHCHRLQDVHEGNFGQQCDRCHNQRKFNDITLKR